MFAFIFWYFFVSVKKDNPFLYKTSSLPIWIHFISFSCLIFVTKTFSTVLSRSHESGNSCFRFQWKDFQHFTSKYDVSYGFHKWHLLCWSFPLYIHFDESIVVVVFFNLERILNFVKCLFFFFWKCLFFSRFYLLYLLLILTFSQFSSVAQSSSTLFDPMNHSTPGLPVHYQLPEFTQTQVHQVSDAIQPPHPLLSPSPPACIPSQHQGLFQ